MFGTFFADLGSGFKSGWQLFKTRKSYARSARPLLLASVVAVFAVAAIFFGIFLSMGLTNPALVQHQSVVHSIGTIIGSIIFSWYIQSVCLHYLKGIIYGETSRIVRSITYPAALLKNGYFWLIFLINIVFSSASVILVTKHVVFRGGIFIAGLLLASIASIFLAFLILNKDRARTPWLFLKKYLAKAVGFDLFMLTIMVLLFVLMLIATLPLMFAAKFFLLKVKALTIICGIVAAGFMSWWLYVVVCLGMVLRPIFAITCYREYEKEIESHHAPFPPA